MHKEIMHTLENTWQKTLRMPYLGRSMFAFLMGLFFVCYVNDWLIVRLPAILAHHGQNAHTHVRKKNIKLSYYHADNWHHENVALIWSTDVTQTIHHLVSAWLALLEENGIVKSKLTLQTVLLATHGTEALLSFDGNFLPQEASTYTKWMLVESLLKTLRDNDIPIKTVRLLVHHQPLLDNHIDFTTRAWPVTGFAA